MRFPVSRHGLPLLLVMVLPTAALAEAAHQRQELTAVLRQLDGLERLVRSNAANTPVPVVAGERYHFDTPRLLADLTQVRRGIQSYLTPSRAQPRDVTELSGDYRSERAATDEASQP